MSPSKKQILPTKLLKNMTITFWLLLIYYSGLPATDGLEINLERLIVQTLPRPKLIN